MISLMLQNERIRTTWCLAETGSNRKQAAAEDQSYSGPSLRIHLREKRAEVCGNGF